jgi:ribosomal protein S18 acetylase RimI-like enzyme
MLPRSILVSIGALHTAPAYRKKGLAALVVAHMEVHSIRRAIASNPLAASVLKGSFLCHAECEAYNVVAMKWFCGLGFEKVIDNTWTMINF